MLVIVDAMEVLVVVDAIEVPVVADALGVRVVVDVDTVENPVEDPVNPRDEPEEVLLPDPEPASMPVISVMPTSEAHPPTPKDKAPTETTRRRARWPVI